MFGLEEELYETIREKNVEIDKLKDELHDSKNNYIAMKMRYDTLKENYDKLYQSYLDVKNQGNTYPENFHCKPDNV